MIVQPGTTVRIASAEAASLTLDADAVPASARLEPRIGEPVELETPEGVLEVPRLGAPNLVDVEWIADGESIASTRIELVSRHYFRLDELKGFGDGQDDFDALPEGTLAAARQAATEVFEEAAKRSFVERIGRTKDYGRDKLLYLAHNDVGELLAEGYRLASDNQVERDAAQPCEFPRWIEYVYGMGNVPSQVSRAVLELAAYMLRPTNRPVGATGESTDAGYIHFTTAGRDGATDIPEVNAAIEMFGRGERYLW